MQTQLRDFCKWVAEHAYQDPETKRWELRCFDIDEQTNERIGTGRRMGVCWMDESFLYSHYYRRESWTHEKDKTCDSKRRGDGVLLSAVAQRVARRADAWLKKCDAARNAARAAAVRAAALSAAVALLTVASSAPQARRRRRRRGGGAAAAAPG